MTITTDTLILAGAAAALLLLCGLVASIWRGVLARRRLRATLGELAAREAELHEALLDNHGKAVQLDKLTEQLELRAADAGSLQDQLGKLRDELGEQRAARVKLETQQSERQSRHEEQIALLNKARDDLKKEFENLANRIFEDKGKSFTATSRASLEDLLKPFREQISGFQQRINEVHDKSLQGNEVLKGEIGKLRELGLEMNTQASNLTSALKGDKKTTGNWGETQLERTLEMAGLVRDEHYLTQAAFRDEEGARKLPDFLILLPDGKSLVVDSKVSLVDYERAVTADNDDERAAALAAHVRAVRSHIDDLNVKDYANLPDIGSPDFVLMFLPIEPAYIEAMKHNRELFDYGYGKNVIMVSHTTLMPILRTVANLWKMDKSNREAREISRRAGDIYNQVELVAERLGKLGSSMRAAQNHYNDTVTSLVGKQGLHTKVEKFGELSTKATRDMPALERVDDELDDARLEVLSPDDDGAERPQVEDARDKVKPIRADKDA